MAPVRWGLSPSSIGPSALCFTGKCDIWMFVGMTRMAQNLNIIGLIPEFRILRPFFDVMAFQFFCATAFLAFANLFLLILNNGSYLVRAVCYATLPIMMVFASGEMSYPRDISYSTLWAIKFISASRGATIASATMSFSSLKYHTANFAGVLNHGFSFSGLKFIRTFAGTGVCFGANMRVWPRKFSSTCFANKRSVTALFDVTEVCHGLA